MKKEEFNKLKVGHYVYQKDGAAGMVDQINRTTGRINVIGLGNRCWRYFQVKLPKGTVCRSVCGACLDYEVVERAVYKPDPSGFFSELS